VSKRGTIATVTFSEGIIISELIDTLTSYVSTFQADLSTSLDRCTSSFHASWILRQKIHWVNGITVTIQTYNNPDAVVVQKARYGRSGVDVAINLAIFWTTEIGHHKTIAGYVDKDCVLPNTNMLFILAIELIHGKPMILWLNYSGQYITSYC